MAKKKMPPQLLEYFAKKNKTKEGDEKGLKAARAAKKHKNKK